MIKPLKGVFNFMHYYVDDLLPFGQKYVKSYHIMKLYQRICVTYEHGPNISVLFSLNAWLMDGTGLGGREYNMLNSG